MDQILGTNMIGAKEVTTILLRRKVHHLELWYLWTQCWKNKGRKKLRKCIIQMDIPKMVWNWCYFVQNDVIKRFESHLPLWHTHRSCWQLQPFFSALIFLFLAFTLFLIPNLFHRLDAGRYVRWMWVPRHHSWLVQGTIPTNLSRLEKEIPPPQKKRKIGWRTFFILRIRKRIFTLFSPQSFE